MKNILKIKPKVPGNLFKREKNGKVLLIHRERRSFLVTNDMGVEIIKLADGTRSVEDIGEIISLRYEAERDVVFNDLEVFFKNVENSGLLEKSFPSSPDISGEFKVLVLHLSDLCNIRCIHCYNSSKADIKEYLKLEKISELLDDFKAMGGKKIVLSGGEPLLVNGIKEIIEKAEKNFEITLLTNGTLIYEENAKYLSEKCSKIQISLDGSCPEVNDIIRGKGTFKKILNGIELLKKNGGIKKIVLSISAMSRNIDDIPNIIELAEKLGVPAVRCLMVRKEGCGKENWENIRLAKDTEEYMKLYRRLAEINNKKSDVLNVDLGFNCASLNLSKEEQESDMLCDIGKIVVVYANGDVYPCQILMDEKFRSGNVYKEKLSEIMLNEKVKQLRMDFSERKKKIKKCRQCEWKNYCESGCAAFAFIKKGTIWEDDGFCELRKDFLYDSVWRITDSKCR